MEDPWRKGDLVISLGGTLEKSKKFTPTLSICRVIEVGENDLLLEDYPNRKFRKIDKAPKETCVMIKHNIESIVSSRPQSAQLGDLVFAFGGARYEERETFTGILYSITYKAGLADMCKILSGEELKNSSYSDLLVLQSNIEQS
jgi:hypothetical protein